MSSDAIDLLPRRVSRETALREFPKAVTFAQPNGETGKGICVIDQSALTRDCLVAALSSNTGNNAIEAFSSVEDMMQRTAGLAKPSVILLCVRNTADRDERLDSALQTIAKRLQTIPVVLISDVDDTALIARALQLGARGYIPASVPLSVATLAIEVVEAGGTYLPTEIYLAHKHCPQDIPEASEINPKSLTPRQWSVLQALRRGKANKVIAIELSMRESTVKVHVRNIMKKLNARNRTEVSFKTNAMFAQSEPAITS